MFTKLFQLGQLVKLKSGGPVMVVTNIQTWPERHFCLVQAMYISLINGPSSVTVPQEALEAIDKGSVTQ